MTDRRNLLMGPLCGLVLTIAGGALARGRAAAAVVVEGRRFDERVRLSEHDLVLNGTGVRAVSWLKGYVAGLYLVERATSAAAVQAQPGPKRLRLQMLQAAPAAEFTRAFDKGMSRNTPVGELWRLRERIERFKDQIAAVGEVRPGDVVDLDFDPARGTLFAVNGTLRGEPIPGQDFYAALLRAFVGERPYDRRLKAGLLGLTR